MSAIERIEASERYSEAVVHGGTVYLAGQVPEHTGGEEIGAQTRDVLAIVDCWLQRAGSSRSSLLSATIYLTDLSRDYAGMNAEWDAWLPAGCAPARTTMEVAKLARAEWRIEVTIVAAVVAR